MSSEDLKPHVGHKVEVKGMMEKTEMSAGSMSSDDKMKTNDNMKSDDKMKHDGIGMVEMKVFQHEDDVIALR